MEIEIGKKRYKVKIFDYDAQKDILYIYVFNTNQVITCNLLNRPQNQKSKKSIDFLCDCIVSPIGGRIIRVHVSPQSHVPKNTPLITIESMKMENEIRAPFNLFIKSISISEGHLVKKDQVLLTIENSENKGIDNETNGEKKV